MNLSGKTIPLSNGSIVFLEPDGNSFSMDNENRRRLSFATQFLGKKGFTNTSSYRFTSPEIQNPSLTGISFNLPLENTIEFAATIRSIGKDLFSLTQSGNLIIFYSPEEEMNCLSLVTLLVLSQQPYLDMSDLDLVEKPFQKSIEEWRNKFNNFNFYVFNDRVTDSIEVKENTISSNNINNGLTDGTISTGSRFDSNEIILSSNQTNPDIEASNLQSVPVQSKLEASPIKSPIVTPESKLERVEKVDEPEIETKHNINTKFSIQVKMMGMISLILALTTSIIIGVATYFFKNDAQTRVEENNLAMVDLVGLKVSSDIESIVKKGEQLVTSMLRPNLTVEEKRYIADLFFSIDKDFIFVGLYSQKENILHPEKIFFNTKHNIDANLSEDEIIQTITRNQEGISRAFLGKPVILNTSPGFSEKSFVLALPANQDSSSSKILVIMVQLDMILPAFEKKGILTTFMVNDEGRAIAHPVEDVILSATNFIDLPIVKSMLTAQVDNGQTRYLNSDGKSFLGSYRKVGFGDAGIISIISEDKAFEEVFNIQERNIYIMIISLCLGLIIVFLFAKSLSRPIINLLYATLEIAKGNFKIGIKPTTNDEVGLLTRYFITMGEGLEEREKVKSILGSMIDPVVVKEAMVDLAALKRGKEAEITAFFSDVAGFSSISEQLTSVDLAALLNEYLSAMTVLLKENEGVLDKYIGDAIVGIFGAPVEVDRHAFKACKASLEMVLKLEDLRNYWQKNDLYSKEAQVMDARIGLNTGSAKVGFMGTDALASYTMMGDTVNLAARLEAAGKDYGVSVMIAEKTNSLIQDEMFTRLLDLVRVKGKNEPVKVYELVSFKSSISPNLSDMVGHYQDGLDEYLKGNWDQAIQSFEKAIQAKLSKDKSSSMLISRCKDYKLHPPGNDWDGVFTRETK